MTQLAGLMITKVKFRPLNFRKIISVELSRRPFCTKKEALKSELRFKKKYYILHLNMESKGKQKGFIYFSTEIIHEVYIH